MSSLVAEWTGRLATLDAELVELYSDWLPRLRAAFGPWRRPAFRDPEGEPDGYGGLSRRGGWERLLYSEWALAEVLPDEFIRRAAMREQLFLRLDRQVPAAAPVTRVWLDCGPAQLGAPRLAHLAILLVLERRAKEAGGTLLWAPLHEAQTLRDTVDPLVLLARRTTERVERFQIPGADEAFVVAAEPLSGVRNMVLVSERKEGVLQVETARSTIELQLPEMGAAGRLLSNPYPRPRPRLVPPRSGESVEALQFAPGGGALIERRGDRLLAWAVPRGPRQRSKIRWVDPWSGEPAPLAACAWRRQGLWTLRLDQGVWKLKGRDLSLQMPAGQDFVLPSGGAVPELVMLPGRYLMGSPQGGRSRNAALVRDGANQLWAFDFDLESPSAVLIGSAVTDPRCTDNTYSWIDPRGAVVRLRPMVQPNAHGPVCLRDHGWSEEDLPVGPIHDAAGAGRLGVENSWALRFGDRSWWLGTLPGWSGIPDGARFSAEQQVIGAVLQSWGEQVDPCLVVVDGGEVWRISERGRVRVLSLDEPVTVGAVGGRPGSPVVAVGTRSGWLHVQPVLAEAKAPWLSFVPRVEER